MLRLADGVRLLVRGGDGIVANDERVVLELPGDGGVVRTLGRLLRTPRSETLLRRALPGRGDGENDVVALLCDAGVLVPSELGSRLAELHAATTAATAWADASPERDTARALREFAGEGSIPLPDPEPLDGRLEAALAARRSAWGFTGSPLRLARLAQLLALAAGAGPERTDAPVPLAAGAPPGPRTYPSGGALYPIETFVYPLAVESLPPAFYVYQVLPHRLRPAAPALPAGRLTHLLGDHPVDGAGAVLLLVADLARASLAKYGEKAYRLLLLEAGHLAQNALLVAAATGLAGLPLCGFHDEALAAAARLEYPYEVVVYALAVGEPA